jgi:hypothetical protein
MPACENNIHLTPHHYPQPTFPHPRLSASRMEFQQRIGQIVAIQMRVNLRSGDTLMPQHFLNRA